MYYCNINNSIDGYQNAFTEFAGVDLDWTNYINNGILVLPKESEEFCEIVIILSLLLMDFGTCLSKSSEFLELENSLNSIKDRS